MWEIGFVLVVVMVDCVLILLIGGEIVVVVYVGWWGFVMRILKEVVCYDFVFDEGFLIVWIGLCMVVCCYEVGDEVVMCVVWVSGSGIVYECIGLDWFYFVFESVVYV